MKEGVSLDEQNQRSARAREFQKDATVTKSIFGLVRARDVNFNKSIAGLVAADGDLSIVNGGCGPVVANGDVTIRNGGCGPLIANGDVSIENGGTQSVIATGGATIGQRAFVGLVLTPKATVEAGGKVLMSTRQTLAFGTAAGIAFALLTRLVGPKR